MIALKMLALAVVAYWQWLDFQSGWASVRLFEPDYPRHAKAARAMVCALPIFIMSLAIWALFVRT